MYASMVLHRVYMRVYRVCLIEVVTPLNTLFELMYVVAVVEAVEVAISRGRGSSGSMIRSKGTNCNRQQWQ